MKFKRPQLITLGVAIVAVVLFLLLPRTEENTVEADLVTDSGQASDYVSASLEHLSERDRLVYDDLQEKLAG